MTDTDKTAAPPPDDGILRRWIIVHEPGLVPELKMPPTQSAEGVLDFLIALRDCRPQGTTYTVARLTWNNDLWVNSGDEELTIAELSHPRLFKKRVARVRESIL